MCGSQGRGSSKNLLSTCLWLIHPNLASLDHFGVFVAVFEVILYVLEIRLSELSSNPNDVTFDYWSSMNP